MSQFVNLGLIFLLQITAVVQLVHRLFLIIRTPKMGGKRWKTATAEMRAWRLSAVEPLITTLFTIPVLFVVSTLFFRLENQLVLTVLYIIPIINMLTSSWQINKYGEGHRFARLANTVIWVRTILLSTSAFFLMRHADAIVDGRGSQSLYWSVIAPIACAFFVRTVFVVHQNLVVDKMDVEAAASRKRRITLIGEIEEEEVEEKEGNELWDEQVALIERLKGEEVRVEV